MSEEKSLRERLHEAVTKYDGKVTNGSMEEVMKVVDAVIEARVTQVENVWRSRESEKYRQSLLARVVAAEKSRDEVLEEAYLIARGGSRFAELGAKQLYWKGRCDAAAEIRAAKSK